ncbi:hypothetical protein OROGR_017277 [Orobanche gracilis]
MEEDSSSPINFAIGEVPDAAYNLQPPSLLLKPSTTIQEIRCSQKNISSIIGDLEVLEALAANMVDQVGEEMDSDED